MPLNISDRNLDQARVLAETDEDTDQDKRAMGGNQKLYQGKIITIHYNKYIYWKSISAY